jgi:hypothetical protein
MRILTDGSNPLRREHSVCSKPGHVDTSTSVCKATVMAKHFFRLNFAIQA